MIVSSRVLKHILAILIIVSVCTFIAKDSESQIIPLIESTVKGKPVLSEFNNQPFSAFEISQHNSITGNNCRQQNHDVTIDNKTLQAINQEHRQCPGNEPRTGITFKNYLSHIYPSHNFW